MEIKKNIRNLVIFGAWNSLLFTPKWLNNNIFDGELPPKINTEVAIHGNIVLHRVFQLPHFKIEISPDRLCFILNNNDDVHFQALLNAANSILTKLQHTPLQSVGINFVYIEKGNVPFNNAQVFYELEDMIQANEIITLHKIDHNIRISINRDNDKTEFDFNFSYTVENTFKAKEILTAGIFNKKLEESTGLTNNILEKFNGK